MATIPLKEKYHITQHVNSIGLCSGFDILDTKSGERIGLVSEKLSASGKLARLFLDKAFLSSKFIIYNKEKQMLLRIDRKPSLLTSVFYILNPEKELIAIIKENFSLTSPSIQILDKNKNLMAHISGKYKFRNFEIKNSDGKTLASIKHRFEGLKDVLTTADDYMLESKDDSMTLLSIAAVICIDCIYHD